MIEELKEEIQELLLYKIGKKEFVEYKSFFLEENRSTNKLAQIAKDQTDNLQTKYHNLATFYCTNKRFEKELGEFTEKFASLNQRVAEIDGEYDEES